MATVVDPEGSSLFPRPGPESRDPRLPGDERDVRDPRLPGDERDVRDVRLPGDERDSLKDEAKPFWPSWVEIAFPFVFSLAIAFIISAQFVEFLRIRKIEAANAVEAVATREKLKRLTEIQAIQVDTQHRILAETEAVHKSMMVRNGVFRLLGKAVNADMVEIEKILRADPFDTMYVDPIPRGEIP